VLNQALAVQGNQQMYKANLVFLTYVKPSANTTYSATLKEGIQEKGGNTIPLECSWTFTT